MPLKTLIASLIFSLFLPAAVQAMACQLPGNQTGIAQSVLDLANAQRARAGLPALSSDAALARSALSHACDMQRTGRFDHRGSNGSTHVSRAKAAGCRWKGTLAENIGWGYKTPEAAVAGWMGSPEHRANLLNRKVRIAGAAFVPSKAGGYWVMELAGGC